MSIQTIEKGYKILVAIKAQRQETGGSQRLMNEAESTMKLSQDEARAYVCQAC